LASLWLASWTPNLACLTFLTSEPGKSLLDRFNAPLGTHTQFFDRLVAYFMISGLKVHAT
jgi:hypothetical protein